MHNYLTNNTQNTKTKIIYGVENIIDAELQFFSKTKRGRIDTCMNYTRPPLAILIEPIKKALLDAKSRDVKLRYLTEINNSNISYCKELIGIVDELRHLDGIKANSMISETEFLAPLILYEEGKIASQIIYSDVKEIVEQGQYIFDTLWNIAIPAEQKINEIEEGIEPEFFQVINDREKANRILVNLAKSVKKEALFLLPNDKAMIRVDKLGIIDYLINASQQKNAAVIKIICLLSEENSGVLKKISEHAPNIKILNGKVSPHGMFIVDNEKFFGAEMIEPQAETFSEAIGFGLYSNSRRSVESFKSFFELLWNEHILNEELKRADNMQKEFINVAAHELRTPIQPILGLSEVLYTKIKDIEQRQLLEAITRNAKRLQQLTEDILDVSKIETQSLKLKKDQFNLNDVISNAVRDYTKHIEKGSSNSNLKLFYKPAADDMLSVVIGADKARLTQVISNLLNNAVKFTKKGTIFISTEKKDNHILVSIKDTGTGIDPEILPRLFTKFATKSEKGTGLGLFISKSIVEAHDGKIWAENNADGKGATFSFSLPIVLNNQLKPSKGS